MSQIYQIVHVFYAIFMNRLKDLSIAIKMPIGITFHIVQSFYSPKAWKSQAGSTGVKPSTINNQNGWSSCLTLQAISDPIQFQEPICTKIQSLNKWSIGKIKSK